MPPWKAQNDPKLYQMESAFLWEYGKLLLFYKVSLRTYLGGHFSFQKNMNSNWNDTEMIRRLENPVLPGTMVRIWPI